MGNSIGFYVEKRPLTNGRVRLRFVVPARLRPADYPKTRPIFLEGEEGVDLENLTPAQHAELRRQAEAYYADFRKACAGVQEVSAVALTSTPMQAWRRIIGVRRCSEHWLGLKERSAENYTEHQRSILKIALKHGLDIASTPQPEFEAAFRAENSSLWQRKNFYQELRKLCEIAMQDGTRPMHMTITSRTKPQSDGIQIWTPDDVYALVTECLRQNEAGLAKLILAQWEIGQRLTSARNLRYGHNYKDGWFFFNCRKTGAPIRVPVLNPSARQLLDRDYRHGAYMFVSGKTGHPFSEGKLSARFGYIRKQTVGYRSSRLQLRWLRHSVLVAFGRAGATIPEIAAVTGHTLAHCYRTLEFYLTRDERTAAVAMAKREKHRLDGVEGEQLVNGARSLWIADKFRTEIPLTPRELKLYGPA
jgi:hypothetical protein